MSEQEPDVAGLREQLLRIAGAGGTGGVEAYRLRLRAYAPGGIRYRAMVSGLLERPVVLPVARNVREFLPASLQTLMPVT